MHPSTDFMSSSDALHSLTRCLVHGLGLGGDAVPPPQLSTHMEAQRNAARGGQLLPHQLRGLHSRRRIAGHAAVGPLAVMCSVVPLCLDSLASFGRCVCVFCCDSLSLSLSISIYIYIYICILNWLFFLCTSAFSLCCVVSDGRSSVSPTSVASAVWSQGSLSPCFIAGCCMTIIAVLASPLTKVSGGAFTVGVM
jgi:hypothetical protein